MGSCVGAGVGAGVGLGAGVGFDVGSDVGFGGLKSVSLSYKFQKEFRFGITSFRSALFVMPSH